MKSQPSCNTPQAPRLPLYSTLTTVNVVFPQERVKKEETHANVFFYLYMMRHNYK